MLILTRRPTQSVKIGSDVTLTILEIRGTQVRIGVDAPPQTAVLRQGLDAPRNDAHRARARS